MNLVRIALLVINKKKKNYERAHTSCKREGMMPGGVGGGGERRQKTTLVIWLLSCGASGRNFRADFSSLASLLPQ